MTEINRREFVGMAAAGAGAFALGAPAGAGANLPLSLDDKITLGRTGIKSSLVGIGTGSVGFDQHSNQTRLGVKKFVELIHHAFDRGIRFFDVADGYGSHVYLREAIKELPREKFVIQTKIIHRGARQAQSDLDRFRLELGVDYLDTVLMHVVTEPDWNRRFQGVKDVLAEAKQKGIIKAHGCSCHSFEALKAAADDPWVQVDLARFNPWGAYMDAKPEEVKPVLQKMKAAGKGVIGMKILAQGDQLKGEDRMAKAKESIKHALSSGAVDMMVIGFETPRQIDEVLGQARVALAELRDGARLA